MKILEENQNIYFKKMMQRNYKHHQHRRSVIDWGDTMDNTNLFWKLKKFISQWFSICRTKIWSIKFTVYQSKCWTDVTHLYNNIDMMIYNVLTGIEAAMRAFLPASFCILVNSTARSWASLARLSLTMLTVTETPPVKSSRASDNSPPSRAS